MYSSSGATLLVSTPFSVRFARRFESCIALGPWVVPPPGEELSKNTQTLKYHWANRVTVHEDWQSIKKESSQILSLLAAELNIKHKTNFPEASWNFVIGYWLLAFCTVVFDRFRQLELASFQESQICYHGWNFPRGSQTPYTTQEARELFVDDVWNEGLIQKIASYFPNLTRVEIKVKSPRAVTGSSTDSSQAVWSGRNLLRNFLGSAARLGKPHEEILVVAGSPMQFDRLLRWSMVSREKIYFLHHFGGLGPENYRLAERKWSLPTETEAPLYSKVIRDLIPEYLPVIFWEGFTSAQTEGLKVFPAKVSKIFTSNMHFKSDSFRIAVANLRASGAKLIVGQHGGGALHKINAAISWEMETSDLCLTTGPGNNVQAHMKTLGQFWSRVGTRKRPQNGPPVLITGLMPRYVFDLRSMALPSNQSQQFQWQRDFYRLLPAEISSALRVRLYPKGDYGWNQRSQWTTEIPTVKFDPRSLSLAESVRKASIVIVDYQASTYAEVLAANIPTLLMWDPKTWEASPDSDPQFSSLVRVGILHFSPQSAARKLTSIWNRIDSWWQSSDIQEARLEFCSDFAVREFDYPKRINEIISEAG